MRYVVAPNQSIPVVTPKIVTVNTCINSLNISWGGGAGIENQWLNGNICAFIFSSRFFAIISKVVKSILISSVLCTCQNRFSQKDTSQVTSTEVSSQVVWGGKCDFSAGRLFVFHFFSFPGNSQLWVRADSHSLGKCRAMASPPSPERQPSTGSAALTCPSFLKK